MRDKSFCDLVCGGISGEGEIICIPRVVGLEGLREASEAGVAPVEREIREGRRSGGSLGKMVLEETFS